MPTFMIRPGLHPRIHTEVLQRTAFQQLAGLPATGDLNPVTITDRPADRGAAHLNSHRWLRQTGSVPTVDAKVPHGAVLSSHEFIALAKGGNTTAQVLGIGDRMTLLGVGGITRAHRYGGGSRCARGGHRFLNSVSR